MSSKTKTAKSTKRYRNFQEAFIAEGYVFPHTRGRLATEQQEREWRELDGPNRWMGDNLHEARYLDRHGWALDLNFIIHAVEIASAEQTQVSAANDQKLREQYQVNRDRIAAVVRTLFAEGMSKAAVLSAMTTITRVVASSILNDGSFRRATPADLLLPSIREPYSDAPLFPEEAQPEAAAG